MSSNRMEVKNWKFYFREKKEENTYILSFFFKRTERNFFSLVILEMEIGDFLHFRVHTDELDLDDLLTFLTEQVHIEFVVKEYGKSNREHIHACIKLKCAKQTFIDRMKKKFPIIKGNGYYGLGKLKKDYDTNARYCYKGKANDYPDILRTIHTEEKWKKYYTEYWKIYTEIHKPVDCFTDIKVKSKVKCKTFSQKLLDEILDDFDPLVQGIWYYKGYKQDPKNPPSLQYEELQNMLGDLLLQRLGKSAKAIDKFIYERIYKSLWFGILSHCPENLTYQPAISMVECFRNTL